jgi:hypothetical protein
MDFGASWTVIFLPILLAIAVAGAIIGIFRIRK